MLDIHVPDEHLAKGCGTIVITNSLLSINKYSNFYPYERKTNLVFDVFVILETDMNFKYKIQILFPTTFHRDKGRLIVNKITFIFISSGQKNRMNRVYL